MFVLYILLIPILMCIMTVQDFIIDRQNNMQVVIIGIHFNASIYPT